MLRKFQAAPAILQTVSTLGHLHVETVNLVLEFCDS